jgi:hypothetical protein
MTPPIRFQCAVFGLQLGLLVYTYGVQHKYIQFPTSANFDLRKIRLAQNSTCAKFDLRKIRLAQNSTCARTCVKSGECNKQPNPLEPLTCPLKADVLDIYISQLLYKTDEDRLLPDLYLSTSQIEIVVRFSLLSSFRPKMSL